MDNEWRDELRSGLEMLADRAVVSGALPADVFTAIIEEASRLRDADERDPDPADEVSEQGVEEPANDWPAADP